jgi:hypothetical protein
MYAAFCGFSHGKIQDLIKLGLCNKLTGGGVPSPCVTDLLLDVVFKLIGVNRQHV